MEDPAKSTPKRKRPDPEQELGAGIPTFSFQVPGEGGEDEAGSPRCKMAHRFRGLALEGKDSRSEHAVDEAMGDDGPETRKRQRLREESQGAAEESRGDLLNLESGAESPLQRSYPSINRLAESKSRRKRTSSPPLSATRKASGIVQYSLDKPSRKSTEDSDDSDTSDTITDPLRASLTWHADEITVYDPDDSDDDGTGINGIGFKPTPALAQARTERRRQQLAEYRRREEGEARARRLRRRERGPGSGGTPSGVVGDALGGSRRVRFTEDGVGVR